MFFFVCYDHLPHLHFLTHSFPPRRSSDRTDARAPSGTQWIDDRSRVALEGDLHCSPGCHRVHRCDLVGEDFIEMRYRQALVTDVLRESGGFTAGVGFRQGVLPVFFHDRMDTGLAQVQHHQAVAQGEQVRSEEHTSELQSIMTLSYDV